MKITGIDFVAIPAKDLKRAVTFYEEVLGLERTDAFEGSFIEFKVGRDTIALFDPTAMGRKFQAVEAGALALHVADVEAFTEKLKAQNVEFMSEPFDSGVCHGAFFKDSEGNALSLHHRYAPEGKQIPKREKAKAKS